MGNHNIRVDAIGLAAEVVELRNEIARLKNQTNWVCKCGGTDCEGQKENAALRQALADMPTCRCGLSTDEQCALSVENADLRNTLDAVIWADERAVDLWRAAHPGKELVIPDRTKLVGWLLEQNAALRDSIDHAETLLCNSLPMAHCKQSDWDNVIRKWRDQKHAIDAARKEAQP